MNRSIEVEYRYNGYLRPKIVAVFGDQNGEIASYTDTYFLLCDDGSQHRVRKISGSKGNKYYEMRKTPLDGFLSEESSPLEVGEYKEIINSKTSVVQVSGVREVLSYSDLTCCIDTIDHLGKWTEFEKLVKNTSEIGAAEAEIIEAVRRLGLDISQLTKELYPHMVMKAINENRHYTR